MMANLVPLLVILVFTTSISAQTPCAFNAHCQCQGQGPSYSQVACTSATTFPKFNNVPQGITVQKFLISGTFDSVPATGLDQFTKIDDLTLEHTGSGGAVKIKIENDAEYMLVNNAIGRLTLSGFTGLLPLNDPGAFYGAGIDKTTLARLTSLTIKQPNLEFQKDSFQNATSLKQLILRDDDIVDGNPKVRQFVDIKSTLTDLDLGHNHLTNYAAWKLSLEELTKLETLRLDHNKFQNLNGADFSLFPSLRILDLSGNPLPNLDSTLFASSNPVLEELYLNDCNLDKVPYDLLGKVAKNLTTLHLANNHLQKLTSADFPFETLNHLANLVLDGNPIKEVDLGTFKELRALFKFTIDNWALETLDLSIFGVDKNGVGYLNVFNNSNLTSIEVSNSTFIPVALNRLEISGNRLKSIDHSITSLFHRNDFQIIIANEPNFDCPYDQSTSPRVETEVTNDNSTSTNQTGTTPSHLTTTAVHRRPSPDLQWLAELVFCEHLVTIADTVLCANTPMDSNSTSTTTLNQYLRGFEIACALSSTGGGGKTTANPTIPTTKGAVQNTFSIWLLLSFVIFMSIVTRSN